MMLIGLGASLKASSGSIVKLKPLCKYRPALECICGWDSHVYGVTDLTDDIVDLRSVRYAPLPDTWPAWTGLLQIS